MLSRFSKAGVNGLRSCLVVKFQPITTSAVVFENQKTSNPPPEYPKPSSKRDFVNFPRPVQREYPPPVRMGFIPESWFNFMYPKTGYTGLYMFFVSTSIYLLSKEILVLEPNAYILGGFIILFIVTEKKFGDKIAAIYNKLLEKQIKAYDQPQENEKQEMRDLIKNFEGQLVVKSAMEELTKGRLEYIQLQMELAFRQRLHDAYKEVKNKLDCQAEMENVERRIIQKNLIDYVLANVLKSITPDMEKKSMQFCISELNTLSANA